MQTKTFKFQMHSAPPVPKVECLIDKQFFPTCKSKVNIDAYTNNIQNKLGSSCDIFLKVSLRYCVQRELEGRRTQVSFWCVSGLGSKPLDGYIIAYSCHVY